MKKLVICVVSILLAFSMISCSGSNPGTNSQSLESEKVEESTEETAIDSNTEEETEKDNQEEVSDLDASNSSWKVATIVDEFGDPVEATDEKAVFYSFSGDFSNTATNSSPLTGAVYVTETKEGLKIISFKLNEYGDVPIAFTNADELSIKYKVDDVVFEYSLGGTAPSSDLVMDIVSTGDLTPKSNELFFQQLCRGKDIKCIIRIGHSQYNFNIKGEGIKNACVEAGIIPFEAIDISSIEGCLQALKAKQQRDEVELYLVNSHSNFDRLSNDEIISAFTNSKWIMYGKLGGEGESAEFSEDMVSGTFLDRALRDHENWSAKNDMLEAYGLEYEVYHVEENYYLLYVDKTHTSIIAEKVNN